MRFPNGKRAPLPAIPLQMDGHCFDVRHQPPAKGEHSRAVLAEAGYTEAEIAALVARGIVATPD